MKGQADFEDVAGVAPTRTLRYSITFRTARRPARG